jgi:glyoxylase-like metal-dependent hydrolase (beta-lactamase superfamily II)
MKRREFLIASTTAMVAAAFRAPLQAWQQAPPATTFTPIRNGVGYFTGRGGTIGWMVNKDAAVAVDTQYANTAQICVDGLKERASGRQIDITFNTHHHGDHTGGNAIFKAASKRMVAHARVVELMKQMVSAQPDVPPPAVADRTFTDTWSETLGGETVTARHYGPGHTGGDGVIHFRRANVVHMGDLLFVELHPRVDRPSGASIQNWMRTLETVAKEMSADTLFIAGHARPGQPVLVKHEALTNLRSYFDAVLTHVRKGIADKKAQADIVSVAALPGFEQYQSSGQILTLANTLTAAYEELSALK